ncbi:MAG TPA: EspA/EspE family type VII secretion system effector, partial [Sporichthyaceae bacterium]|nr:EspA/EspE family type VII secretion system effector [Sporichthyaceae bacterium]
MGVQGKLENVGKAALLRAANAPILTGGQLVIAGMKLTTGFGEPEDGARFGQGGARLHGAAATLMSAQATESWSGAGATAYSVTDVKQMTRARAMAAADHEVHGVLATEAFQIDFHRDRLDGVYNWLADVGLLTSALGLVPGVGQGLKAAADAQAVLVAVGRSSLELDQLSSEVEVNAAALQQLVGRYEKVEQTADLSQAVEDQDPPAPLPPPPEPSPEEKPERSPEDESKDQPAEGEPPTPPPTPASGSPAQFVASPVTGGPPRTPSPRPPAAVAQVPASPARSATGAPPAGGMPPAAISGGAAPTAPAPGIPIGLIKE